MRLSAFALTAALALSASTGLASPTCKDRNGDTARCGAAAAMPLGWSPPAGMLADRQAPGPPAPSQAELISVIVLIAAFISLIALMPDFDGGGAGDWGAQEDDEPRD